MHAIFSYFTSLSCFPYDLFDFDALCAASSIGLCDAARIALLYHSMTQLFKFVSSLHLGLLNTQLALKRLHVDSLSASCRCRAKPLCH